MRARKTWEEIVSRERESGRQSAKRYAARKRAELAARRDAWVTAHPDLARLIDTEIADDQRRQKVAMKAKATPVLRMKAKAWHEAHLGQRRAYLAKWKSANRGRCNAHNRKRHAVKA